MTIARTETAESAEKARIMLGLLESVEQDGAQSQRRLAAELGIALGLVNAYLRRCVNKGLVKISEAPARRYAYYLTPQGFSEKSRLTVEYLTSSFGFFRRAKADCLRVFQRAGAQGIHRILLAGRSDLAEIAALCAIEQHIEIVGLIDPDQTSDRFVGRPVFASFDDVTVAFDAVMVTDLMRTQETSAAVLERVGAARLLVPDLLRGRLAEPQGAPS